MAKRRHRVIPRQKWLGEYAELQQAYPEIAEVRLEVRYFRDLDFPRDMHVWKSYKVIPEIICRCGRGTWDIELIISDLIGKHETLDEGHFRCSNRHCDYGAEYRLYVEYKNPQGLKIRITPRPLH